MSTPLRHGALTIILHIAAGAAVSVACAWPSPSWAASPPAAPCRDSQDLQASIEELPATWNLQLVGVAADRVGRPNAVIRVGQGNATGSAVFAVGDFIFGRLKVLAVGFNSVLVRADGRLHTLRLKGRRMRHDWRAEIEGWRACDAPLAPGTSHN